MVHALLHYRNLFPFANRFKFLLSFTCAALMMYNAEAQTKVVGYVTNDHLYDIDYEKITHLNLAFENPDADGDLTFSAANDTYITEAHKRNVKVLVSIAGGGASHTPTMQNLYFNLISDANRAAFVEKVVAYVVNHNFDGLDVDLEGPAINSDYGKFIKDLSLALKPHNKLLTTALSHANGASNVPDEVMQLFDFINIMAYDATGPWKPDEPGQHSSYEFAVESLNYWIDRGLPKEKAILGVPFYGYGFGTDFNEGMSFAQILQKFPGSENSDVIGNTIYYNGLPTIAKKAQLVIDGGYGGLMIWQLAHDAKGNFSLLNKIHEVVNNITAIEVTEDQPFELYPNPVDSIINLRPLGFKHNRISIINAAGNECLLINQPNDLVDVSMLPSGVYIIRLSNDEEQLSKKFVKQ